MTSKFRWITLSLSLSQKPLKNLQNPLKPKNSQKLLKKMCSVSANRLSIQKISWRLLKTTKKVNSIVQKLKRVKNSYEVYLIEFACSTQNNKKIIETPNQPIEKKNS
jgi:hypothetical protein